MKLQKIHEDDRGSIEILTEDIPFEEVTIFQTKEGYARGGCIHEKNDEICFVLSGKVTYVVGDKTYHAETGASILVPRNTPHYYVSETDSILFEYGATAEEKKVKHAEYRTIVDEINRLRDEWEKGIGE